MTAKAFDSLWRAARLVLCSVWVLLAGSQVAWAAITLVGSASSVRANNSSAPLTIGYPAGVADGDILVAQIAVRGNQTITAPAGWVLIHSSNGASHTQAVYWKRVVASSPPNYDWHITPGRAAGAIVAYRDVDAVAPVSVFSVSTTSGDVTASSVTPTVSGTRLIGLFSLASGNGTVFNPPAGMTERVNINAGGGSNVGVAILLADEAYAGGTAATGSRIATGTAAAGIAHLVALQPNVIANYRLDETVWTGASGQVVDSSGRSHHATAVNGAATGNAAPAIPGTPGTCGYGQFDGSNDYVAVPPSFPNLVTDFTITAWIRTTNNAKSGQRIFVDDQSNSGGYGFSLGDGGAGRLRFYARATSPVSLDTGNVIANNTWYFVAAVMNATATTKTKSLYVYNQAGTQIAYVTQTYTGTWGTDSGAASIGGENNASSESGSSFRFGGSLDEVSVFSGALSAAKLGVIMSQTRPCSGTPSATPSGFNAFEIGTAPNSATGVIRTKIAASVFGLDFVALKSSGTAVETAFAGDVKLELVDASAGATCGAHALIRNLGTLSFTAADLGRKTQTGINEPDAWPNARVRVSHPATGAPTIVACSNDNFAIRPAGFGPVTVSDADSASAGTTRILNNTGASGGIVHKAGQPFTLTASAIPATAANYTGTPSAVLSACVDTGCPTTVGSFSVGSAAVSGVINSTTATYSEVGAFTMQLQDQTFASVDAGDTVGDCSATGRYVCSVAVNVGRFVPDHFDLATAGTPPVFNTFNDTTCGTRSFTYVGQPFGYATRPEATITAKNAAGGTTLNYAGALWKAASAGVTTDYVAVTGAVDDALEGTPTVTPGSGTGSVVTDASVSAVIAFARGAPVAPFNADITLTMGIEDTAENGVPGNGIITTATPAVFSSMAFDAGNQIRFGQLVLSNAHGSELLNLPVPIETRFWNGAGFTRNTADFCTQLGAAQVSLANWRRDLNACETSVSLSGRFNAGRGNLRFSAPGAGNTGSVDLAVQLGATAVGSSCVAGVATPAVAASQSWLQGRSSSGAYDQNPVARASFGLHRGSKPLIYLREMH